MKGKFLLFLFIFCIAGSRAQIRWNPQWLPGSSQVLEYRYGMEMYADTMLAFDTAHARIETKFIGAYYGDYLFQWKFDQFYGTTVHVKGEGDKRVIYQMVSKTLARCPVKFKIAKSGFKLTITNEAEIDSVANLVMDDMLTQRPEIQSRQDKDDWKHALYQYSMYRNVYKVIEDFYWLYQVIEQKPGVKKKIQPYILNDLSSDAQFSDSTTGFYIFEDSDPKSYKWKLEANMDMSAMINAYSDIGEKIQNWGLDDSIVKKTPKPAPASSAEIVKAEIILLKPGMEVTSYSVLTRSELHKASVNIYSRVGREIRVIK